MVASERNRTDTAVILQDLQQFTVQIRDAATNAIVGTGFIVSDDGRIVTCAHVVRDAGIDPRLAGEGTVGVYFPRGSADDKSRSARVAAWFPSGDDDVVILKVEDRPWRLAHDALPVLGSAERSRHHQFESYGFPALGDKNADLAYGRIIGTLDPDDGRIRRAKLVKLESQGIVGGMSGAAVLDIERNLVVGVVSETYDPAGDSKNRDAAWAENGSVLGLPPLNLPLQDAPLPKQVAAQTPVDIRESIAASKRNLAPLWVGAPDAVQPRGDDPLLVELDDVWERAILRVRSIAPRDDTTRGQVRFWVDRLIDGAAGERPDGVFWWNFRQEPDVERFFSEALGWISDGNPKLQQLYRTPRQQAEFLAGMLYGGRYLFVLDGLETMQHQGDDLHGTVRDPALRAFLDFFAVPQHRSFCLVLSPVAVMNLMMFATYAHVDERRDRPGTGGRANGERQGGSSGPGPAVFGLAGALLVVIVGAVLWLILSGGDPSKAVLTPLSLTFPAQIVGTPGPAQRLTLTNTGDEPLRVLDVRLTGPDASDFRINDGCSGGGIIVKGGRQCVVEVLFAPSDAGTRTAHLIIDDDSKGSRHVIDLTGEATERPPQVTLAPERLDFDEQEIGTATTREVTVTNSGRAPLQIRGISAGGAFSQTSSCDEVAPGERCEISVRFAPTRAGRVESRLEIRTNAGDHAVPLSGIGSDMPALTLAPLSLEFGSVRLDQSGGPLTVTLTNPRSTPVTVREFVVTGANLGDFALKSDCDGKTLTPRGRCSADVTFSPRGAGLRTAEATVVGSDGTVMARAHLRGTGVAPTIAVAPDRLDFGRVQIGKSSTVQNVTIRSAGTAALTLGMPNISGPNAPDFTRTTNCQSPLQPGQSCTISVTFAPKVSAVPGTAAVVSEARGATLTFTNNAAGSPHTVELSGIATSPPPQPSVAVNPQRLDLRAVEGQLGSGQGDVTVTSTGGSPLDIDRVVLRGQDAAHFKITSDTCSRTTLDPNKACTVRVTYTGGYSDTPRTATLVFISDAPGSPHSVPLSGIYIIG